MKKIILIVFIMSIGLFIFSQDKINSKLTGLGIKKYDVKDNPSKNIKKIYLFNETNVKGGIVILTLNELKMDVMVTILQSKNIYMIKTVEPLNDNALNNKKRMQQLTESLSGLNDTKVNSIADTVSSATKHSKSIYEEIRKAVEESINILNTLK